MAKFGKFFGILVTFLVLVGVSEAKTTSKTATERNGIVAGGGRSLGDCYYAQTSVYGSDSKSIDQTKVVTNYTNVNFSLVIFYTCGGGGGYESIFEISGNSDLENSDLVVAEDKRTAWLKKTMLVEKDGYWYSVEIDLAVIADGETFFNDNQNKSWSGSKSYQQTTKTKSQYHSGQVFGTINVSGFNYFDNGFGYVYEENSNTTVVNK